jgi:HD-GYP domain-containing protein (c-di-GMP phosphodiesterase class II)
MASLSASPAVLTGARRKVGHRLDFRRRVADDNAMLSREARRRPRLLLWLATWAILVSVQVTAAVLPGRTTWWASPTALFVVVVLAASGCVVTAGVVLVVAWREDLAELGLIGAFTMAVSVLPLVHGITTPGVWYGVNRATMSSVFWALPWASVAIVTLAAPASTVARWMSSRWRPVVASHLAVTIGVAGALLVRPSLLPVPSMSSRSAIIVAVVSLSVCAALSLRQLRLSWIAASRQPFFVSVGFAFVGASSLVWVARAPFTPGFWLAHAFDAVGVFLLTIGAAVAFRQRPNVREVVRPLTVHTPLAAFELGLDPIVHRFVASLDDKDPITRDHVVRSAEMAMRVGRELRLSARELHELGLGALLHDIGKLTIPDEVLNKPGRLDAAEYDVIRGHAAAGARLVSGSRALAAIGPIVRGHHERIDGHGYPDGLAGDAIPLPARIVAVCDAFDAMSNTRQYRHGMGAERAIAILREHSGSQWDPVVVDALINVVQRDPISSETLDAVGRGVDDASPATAWCGCDDALPVVVAARPDAMRLEPAR